MKTTGIVSSITIVFILVGETFFRDFFHSVWLVLSILFSVFLIVYGWMDHKAYPGHKNKKNREG